jgi:chromosomal replication initiation ATPase DnaA
VLSGPAGAGKSHLARVWSARVGAALVDSRSLTVAGVPALVADSRAVAVDGADAVAGIATAERALLHLFNVVAEAGGRLLLVATAPAAGWGVVLPDLGSRLRAAPTVALGPPGDDLLAALLVKLLADRQLRPPAEVVAYLVPRMERSCDAARRLATELDRAALAAHRPITLPLARSVLAGLAAAGR